MLWTKDLLADLQSLFKQRFGFSIVTHRLIEHREIVDALCRIRMLLAKDVLPNLQSLFDQRFGFGIVAHCPIKPGQIVEACRRIGMQLTKDFLPNLQSLFEQQLGFDIVTHRLIKHRKIVEACRRIGMLTAFRTFCKNNQFLSQRDRFFKFTLMIELHDLAVQFWRVIILSWSPRVNYEDRTKRQEQNDYVDWSGKRTWPLNFHCSVAGPMTWPREGVFRHRLQWVLQDQVRVD